MQCKLLLYPVDSISAALPLFEQGLGLTLKFRDGERYCALDAGPLTIALVAGEERLHAQPAPAFAVAPGEDIRAALDRLLAQGAQLAEPLSEGPHEWRAVVTTPEGFPIVVSAKRDVNVK